MGHLLAFGDENNQRVSCPQPETWHAFWHTMSVIETCMSNEVNWGNLFKGSLLRLLPLAYRMSLKMEVQPFIWVTVDATLEWISGISWHDREFFRMSIDDCIRLCGFPPDTVFKIGEGEMMAAAFAVFPWVEKSGIPRNIILRTDNRNVSHWFRKGRATHGKANRILKAVMDFIIKRKIEVTSQYLRSAHNISADGLTRWAEDDILDWLHYHRMEQVDVPPEWLRAIDVAGNDLDGPQRAAAIRGNMIGFLKGSHNKVCEWRPGRFATAGLLADWGAPCWVYGITQPIVFSLVEGYVKQRTPWGDISVLIGCAYSQLEINDFKRDVTHVMPRYAILITPIWIQDLHQPNGPGFWTCQKLVDSASLGDLCAAQWWIYGFGPSDSHFDFTPFLRDVRVLHHGYTNAGLPCAEDEPGPARVSGIPNSIGRNVTTRVSDTVIRTSRYSHCPMPTAEVFRGALAHWPLISPEMRIPYICEKLAILGGHPGLGAENSIGHELSGSMMRSYYPRGVARRALAGVLSHYEEGLRVPDFFPNLGRAGSTRNAQASGEEFFTELLTRTFGVGRMNAILPGIAPGTRTR